MAKYNKTLHLIASKLGISDEEKVLRKAAEFERLLETKSTAGSNITDTSKVVICLDLAASLYGTEFDVKQAIKYSGLRPTVYANSKKIISNRLELDVDRLSVAVLCASLQNSGVQALAEKILEQYKQYSKVELDMSLPQYVCMAVYQACRISKVKVSKSKIIEKARLKPAQWNKLEADWSQFADTHFAVKKRGKKEVKNSIENVEENVPMEVDSSKQEEPIETFEPYEQWKKRMLDSAYSELKELEKTQSDKLKDMVMSPRRSPRKTPQKYSPYKSLNTKGSVRLLFPIESN